MTTLLLTRVKLYIIGTRSIEVIFIAKKIKGAKIFLNQDNQIMVNHNPVFNDIVLDTFVKDKLTTLVNLRDSRKENSLNIIHDEAIFVLGKKMDFKRIVSPKFSCDLINGTLYAQSPSK
jgi:hypothetical protein